MRFSDRTECTARYFCRSHRCKREFYTHRHPWQHPNGTYFQLNSLEWTTFLMEGYREHSFSQLFSIHTIKYLHFNSIETCPLLWMTTDSEVTNWTTIPSFSKQQSFAYFEIWDLTHGTQAWARPGETHNTSNIAQHYALSLFGFTAHLVHEIMGPFKW